MSKRDHEYWTWTLTVRSQSLRLTVFEVGNNSNFATVSKEVFDHDYPITSMATVFEWLKAILNGDCKALMVSSLVQEILPLPTVLTKQFFETPSDPSGAELGS